MALSSVSSKAFSCSSFIISFYVILVESMVVFAVEIVVSTFLEVSLQPVKAAIAIKRNI